MKRVLLIFLFCSVVSSANAQNVPTMGELMAAMEQADTQINDLSFHYTLKYWPKGGNKSEAAVVLDGMAWYKKPHLYRSETVDVYLPEKPKHTYIIKIEGTNMITYELLADGTAEKFLSAPATDWATAGYPPQLWRSRLQKKLDEGYEPVIRYQRHTDSYLVRFDNSPDQAMYKIDAKSWLLYSETVWDENNKAFVESLDSDIKINAGVSDDLFRLPEKVTVAPLPPPQKSSRSSTPASGTAHAPNFAGHYDVIKGVNPDGSTYDAHVIIDDKGRDVHYIIWKFKGAPDYHGVGILTDGVLGVGWSDSPGFGVIVYKVDGGKLTGDWLDENAEMEYGYEDLEGPPGLEGLYTITDAAGPDYGDEYTGTVTIRRFGDLYRLTWNIDDQTYTGVGLLKNGLLIVGWGDGAGIVVYEKNGDGLKGIWANQIDSTTGVENMTRVVGPHH